MKIAYSIYELNANHSLNTLSSALKRRGALLKIFFDSERIGYTDCHPWPELGDLDLEHQLKSLIVGNVTPLMECALQFAFVDAQSRVQGKSLLINQKIPQSHFLVTNLFHLTTEDVEHILEEGYTHIKVKMGYDLEREAAVLSHLFSHTSLQLRLDFNESLTLQAFRDFLSKIERLRHCIDFIEDPFPFDSTEWSAIQKEGWILACDRQFQAAYGLTEAAQVLIFKPALHSLKVWKQDFPQQFVVTSYLGHPIGQIAAAYAAAHLDPFCFGVHGLLSHRVYHPTVFSQHLNWKGPDFTFSSGIGCGFADELNQLEWRHIL